MHKNTEFIYEHFLSKIFISVIDQYLQLKLNIEAIVISKKVFPIMTRFKRATCYTAHYVYENLISKMVTLKLVS